MQRYLKAQEYVLGQFNKIYNDNLRTIAIIHTCGVDTMAALLAAKRNVNMELAKIAALFHDISRYADNCPDAQHAQRSAQHAHQYLVRSQDFSTREIDEICFAIQQHSLKQQFDSPLAEVLKDADIMAHYTLNPAVNYTGIKKQRILDSLADLHI